MSIPENTELSFSRTFDAPRTSVWETWTDPQHILPGSGEPLFSGIAVVAKC